MVNFSFAIILVGLSLIVGGWVLARSVANSLATMRLVPWCLVAAGAVIALSRLSSIDPGWKIVTLAVVAGSVGLAIVDIRRRREAYYHAQYPVFTSKPVRSIIGLDGNLRQFYLCKSADGFLVGSDLLEVSASLSMKRQVHYRQSRCRTVFPDQAAAEQVLHSLIDRLLGSSAAFGQAPVRSLSTADGAAFRLHLTPSVIAGVSFVRPKSVAACPIEPTSTSSLPEEMDIDDLIEHSATLHRQLLTELQSPLTAKPMNDELPAPPMRSSTFVMSVTRDAVLEGLMQTLQIQWPQTFADAEAARQELNAIFTRLRQRDPVFAEPPFRSLRTPDGNTVHFHVGEESGAFVVGLEHDTDHKPSDPVRQAHLPTRHAHRSAAEAEVLARHESHRRSEALFATAPLRMILAPDGCHYRGHVGEVPSGYRAGIEFDTASGIPPLTCQSVVEGIFPDANTAEEGLAAAFDRAKQNHPAFSTAPVQSVYLSNGTVTHFHVSPLPEGDEEPSANAHQPKPRDDRAASKAANKSYLQYQQRVLMSQFEGYRREHQLLRSQEAANANPYDPRFAIGIERNTMEGGLALTVQGMMPDYPYVWSAHADLQALSKRLLHNNPLFSGPPVRSIRTPNGTHYHLHVGSVSSAFVVGVESHIIRGATTTIRQQELPEVLLDRAAAEKYLLAYFEAYRQAEAVFKATPPVREITAPDGTHYRFYIAELNGQYRLGMEHAISATTLHQTLLEQIFPDFNSAEIEAYRVRAKN